MWGRLGGEKAGGFGFGCVRLVLGIVLVFGLALAPWESMSTMGLEAWAELEEEDLWMAEGPFGLGGGWNEYPS